MALTTDAVIVNEPVLEPAAMLSAVAYAMKASPPEIVIVTPFGPAGPVRVTVPVTLLPPYT